MRPANNDVVRMLVRLLTAGPRPCYDLGVGTHHGPEDPILDAKAQGARK